MDTYITKETTAKKHKKTISVFVASAVLLAAAFFGINAFFHTSLNRSSITTAVVEWGPVENTITASGELLPEFEQVITSPVNASLQKVLLDAGSPVKAGQPILSLDKSTTLSEAEKLKFQLESKKNELEKLRLELGKSYSDIQSNNAIKQLRINSLSAALNDAKRLFAAGGGTREEIEQASLNLKVAELEKKQLENEIKNKQQTMQLEIREAQIAYDIEANDLRELQRKLMLADIVATRPGVITWVNKNIGASIHEGESLARIADLGSFKVAGTISDTYLDKLHPGMAAEVRINDTIFKGTVIHISPSVQNGLINFDVQLTERSHPLFRPNLKVDVFLVTEIHSHVLRVANGTAFKGALTQNIFIMEGDHAVRRTTHIGLTNFNYVELKDNVQPGDVVITSDMSDYKNTNQITIRK